MFPFAPDGTLSAEALCSRQLAKADILAFQGKFEDAASLYTKNGQSSRAVDLFCDLQQFDRAKEYLQPGDGESAKSVSSLLLLPASRT